MRYYFVDPEACGDCEQPGTVMDRSFHPPIVKKLHYEFDSFWPGDVLLHHYPCFVVAEEAKRRLEEDALTGVEFGQVTVTTGDQFREMYPNRRLPKFFWLKPGNRPGVDEFGIIPNGRLMMSRWAVQVLRWVGLNYA